MRRGWRYRPEGWWCPRHPWPPPWARATHYPAYPYPYPTDPQEELKDLQDLKRHLEEQLSELTKRIEELEKPAQDKR